ncbi:MAG: PilZ domain-containing protein [Candidatus Omnitrophica bacterium]|nr:PilZ domain-containing protein [Candidatus Omnitrophota bacterium]MCB9748201.1 PilZ domain-containing protein [Candidatus Omnitrophota bacterium]
MFNNQSTKKKSGQQPADNERRQHLRIKKNFILTYFVKEKPSEQFEITQLKNISRGGMCFITTQSFSKNQELIIELKTPYISDTVHLQGIVHESHQKVKNMLYETRLEFRKLNTEAKILLDKIIEFFKNEDKG